MNNNNKQIKIQCFNVKMLKQVIKRVNQISSDPITSVGKNVCGLYNPPSQKQKQRLHFIQ